MVVGGGFEPPMFTTWVAALQAALFVQLQKPYELKWHASQDSNLHSLAGSPVNSRGRYHSGQMRIAGRDL